MTETVLIAGGCGGLRAIVAGRLVAKVPVSLILNGRSPLGGPAAEPACRVGAAQRGTASLVPYLAALAALNCKTSYLQADVGDAQGRAIGTLSRRSSRREPSAVATFTIKA